MTLLTVQEAADVLRLDPHTVRRWLREGRLPCVRMSARAIRVDPIALREWMDRQAVSAA